MKKQNLAWFIVTTAITVPLILPISQFDLKFIFWQYFIRLFLFFKKAAILRLRKKKYYFLQEDCISKEY